MAVGRSPNWPTASRSLIHCAMTSSSASSSAASWIYYPTVTREPFRNRGRITDLIASGKLFSDIGQPPLDIESDRVMLCGSPTMLEDLRLMFGKLGFVEGNHSEPGHFVIEKAFVER